MMHHAAALTLLLATPGAANADPWRDACDRFHALAGTPRPATPGSVNVAALADHFRRGEAVGFSGAASVQRGNVTLLNRGYGYADWETGSRMTPDTVFDIGSVSKQFTAAAVLRLEEMGRLRVDQPISAFLPGVPADKRGITIHQLLTHSAGFPLAVQDSLEAPSRSAFLSAALAAPLTSRPGERYSYSNTGYAVLAAIVEIASGEEFETFLRRELWLPAGLLHTGWTQFDRRNVRFARGYNATGAVPTPNPAGVEAGRPTWGRRGAGAILSTSNDLRRWATALRSGRILKAASLSKMLMPHVREDETGRSYYGYGWAISAAPDGRCVIAHNGSNNLHYNVLAIYPQSDLITHSVSLQDLSKLRGAVVGRSARVLFGTERSSLPPTRSVSAHERRRMAGRWRTPDGAELEIIERGSRLLVRATDPAAARLFNAFPRLSTADEQRIATTRARIPAIVDGIARGDYAPLNASLSSSSTPKDESAYWSRKWSEWERKHGPYEKVELIASSRRGDALVTWLLLRFARGTIFAAANYDANGRVLIGNDIAIGPNEVVPSEFVLAPDGNAVFQVHNGSFDGEITIRMDPARGVLVVDCPRGRSILTRVDRPVRGRLT